MCIRDSLLTGLLLLYEGAGKISTALDMPEQEEAVIQQLKEEREDRQRRDALRRKSAWEQWEADRTAWEEQRRRLGEAAGPEPPEPPKPLATSALGRKKLSIGRLLTSPLHFRRRKGK
jgi:hypothetical protein